MERNIAQGVRRIPLRDRRGHVRAHALVDAADHAVIAAHRWCLQGEGYAVRYESVEAAGKRCVYMARQILGITDPAIRTDHENGDRLDNRRANLRSGPAALNNQNLTVLRSDNSSGYRGVVFHKPKGRWWAHARLDGKQHSLGYHDTPEEAALAAAAFRAEHMPFSAEAGAAAAEEYQAA